MQVSHYLKSCFLHAVVCEFTVIIQFTYKCKEENINLKEMREKCIYSFPV